uniref:Glycine N-acyltransferase-like protein n=1 Tax=Podarcis muralis TaxID=64176 RepID=A0A670IXH5_PODMU
TECVMSEMALSIPTLFCQVGGRMPSLGMREKLNSVYGAVMNINRGNPVGHEVIVDSWPDFKAVLTRPQREVLALGDFAGYILWDVSRKHCMFCLLNMNLMRNKIKYKTIHWGNPGFTFSSLNSSHIDLLDETWHFGGSEHSRRYLANMVQCFPSTCILDSNGHPISWIIMESLGTLRHGYTLPSHRRRGYSSMVQRAQARRVHAAGFPVYGLVALDNTPQQKLLVSLGFQRLSELCHYCIHSPAYQ